ncbi:hypothetical protein [Halopseudomonas xiamenensis]|uniref:hypothetical protein n=1 Tax=Halopseudomonas xiamenensis TaxID=157792 RepID=UPI001625CBA8|nr:hypothetical protein [Halopseudomonas xiamenensis]
MIEENSLSVDTPLHDMVWQPNDFQSWLARHRITHPWTLYDVFLVLLRVLFTVLSGGCILVSARIALLHSAQQIDAERH